MVRRFDDDDGQDDGDESVGWSVGAPGVQFAKGMQAQPWLRNSSPPWHLWGNTQRVRVPVQLAVAAAASRQGNTNQLLRINYKRPETWHWIFHARLISGPTNTPGFFTTLFVNWELAIGIGRSAIRMYYEPGPFFAIPPFDVFSFQWGPTDLPCPAGAHVWATQATGPDKTFSTETTNNDTTPVSEIVAQDIQLQVQCIATTVSGNVSSLGGTVEVELSAQFAPKTHVRPDWYNERAPLEQQFPGDEVGGT